MQVSIFPEIISYMVKSVYKYFLNCLQVERDGNKKKWEVERQELHLTLETSIHLAKDKEIHNRLVEKEREIRRMRDDMSKLHVDFRNEIQYTLANPNSSVPMFEKIVRISEFVPISEITLIQ